MADTTIYCQICGQQHRLNEMELSFGLPDDVFTIPEAEREHRVTASDDICVVDNQRFFIRSIVGLPLIDQPGEQYHLGVWAEVGAPEFKTIFDLWEEPSQSDHPPFTAHIANNIPFCGQTNGLEVNLSLTGVNTRPQLKTLAADSILGKLQAEGIYLNDTMRFLHFDQDLPEEL